ncbi:MAG: hypothetical protein AAF970_11380 [Bacteroidota bacterium]
MHGRLLLTALPAWLGVLMLSGTLLSCTQAESHVPRPAPTYRAITLDARRAPEPEVLPALRDLGVSHITLIPFGFQPALHVPELRMNPDARWYSESDTGIRTLAAQADTLGMGVIIKPHIWVGRYDVSGQTRADIGFDDEASWQQWEAQYRTFMLHYADLAAEVEADLLVVGTELARAARERPAFWRGLIAEVRTRYEGPLTYAANWYAEYDLIPFWADLDYIGVQAYFPISDDEGPTDEALRAGWKPHCEALGALSAQVDRPVLFTEFGYRSVRYAAAEPWRWPSRDEVGTGVLDLDLQARLYDAFFAVPWQEPWLAGIIVWKWHPTEEGQRPHRSIAFTPQGKPAEAVMGRAFNAR